MQKKMPVKEAVVFLQKATAALRPVFFPGRECCFSLGYSGAYLSGTSLFLFWGRCRPKVSFKKEIYLNSETKLLLKEECLLNFSSAFPDNRDWQTAWKSQRFFNVLAVNILSYMPWAVRSAGSHAVTLHFWNWSKTNTILKCRRTM